MTASSAAAGPAARRPRSPAADLVAGAVAGAVATWAMGKVTTWLHAQEGRAVRRREEQARGGTSAYESAADQVATLAGQELSDDERARYGRWIHWALGISAGALYGIVRPRVQSTAAARGLAFGAAFFLLVDEVANPVLGLTPGPLAFPWQTHARGLVGHLAFGAAADAVLSTVQPTQRRSARRHGGLRRHATEAR